MATDVAKTLRSIEARKGKVVLAEDWATIHKALAEVGPAVSLIILNGGKPTGPVPPANPASPDMTAPLVATGVTPVQISPTRVDITCDPGYDPPVSGTAGRMRRSQLKRGGIDTGSPVLSGGAGQSVELTWVDIGGATGGASSGVAPDYSITSAGTGIYGTSDSFRFGYVQLSGNQSMVVKLTGFTAADDPFAKFELHVRKSLAANSEFVATVHFPFAQGNGANMEFRNTAAGSANQATRVGMTTSPCWLKLLRVGDVYYAYYSTTGNNWVLIGTNSIALGSTLYWGLALSRDFAGTAISATCTEFAVQNLADLLFVDSTVSPGSYAYTVVHEDEAGNFSTANASTSITVTAPSSTEPFPRPAFFATANYNYGSNTAKRVWMSRHRAGWCDWFAGSHLDPTQGGAFGSMNAVFGDVKARSIARGGWLATHPTEIYKYGVVEAMFKSAGSQRYFNQVSWATAANFLLRSSYPAGSTIDSWYGPTLYAMNCSDGCHRSVVDGRSVNWSEFNSYQELKQLIVEGTAVGGPVTNCDGYVQDNLYETPRVLRYVGTAGDFNEDGVGETDETAAASYRRGERQALDFVLNYSGWSGRKIGGNADNTLSSAEYKNYLDVSIFEGAGGYAWSREANNGWLQMMQDAEAQRANLKTNGRLFMQFAIYVGGTSYTAAQLLEAMYYLGSSLLIDVSTVIVDENAGGYGGTFWMDAYDFNLGQPIDAAGFASWSSGVRRRRFDNGDVYVNPKGNGTRTVALGKTMYVLRGNASGTYTPGQAVTSITLDERRMIMLSSTPT